MEEQKTDKRGRGRPTKLTTELRDKLVSAIKAGSYISVACAFVGIDYTTFRRWMAQGEEQAKGKYRDFYLLASQAEAHAETAIVLQVQQHMPESWQACMAFLERRWPDRWRRSSAVEMSGPNGAPIQVQQIDQAIEEELAKMVAQQQAEISAGVPVPVDDHGPEESK